ncbi:phytase [Streptomyces sp. PTY087I2]|uniref:phytase n=1 Tax=Streptomyces sp. PTY087I2 TaxID=1819298 RepID=UPI00080B75AD|nr:phytase [Streptomyces sp. PTY087I2]OCC07733.1 3-phytase precursor [Streptomyces sp. PTY087I2]
MTPFRTVRPATATTVAVCAALATLTAAAPAPAAARQDASRPLPAVTPRAETATLYDDEQGGNANADDPAIWRNPADPDRSLVIATAKEGGLRVYGLDARLVQSLPAPAAPGPDDAPGRFNNVDLVHGMRLAPDRTTNSTAGRGKGRTADLAVTSDRGHDRLRIHRIDPSRPGGPLTDVTDPAAPRVFSAGQDEVNEQATAYGLATWTDRRSGRSYALASRRNRTSIALLELLPTRSGTVTYRKVRSLDLPSTFRLPDGTAWTPCGEPGELPQVEGMVVDPADGTLFAGQEDVGIWRMPADLRGKPVLVDKVREYGVPGTYDEESEECAPGKDPGFGGTRISADVEGLTLLPERNGDRYLLASSQGDDTFAAYARRTGRESRALPGYAGGFRVTAASATLDGSEACDGAAVLNEPLGSRYPGGLLVVQDGNATPAEEGREATGFKFVDLRKVRSALGLTRVTGATRTGE